MRFKKLETADEWNWFKQRTSVILCEDTRGIVCRDDKGRLAAAVVFDSFGLDSCHVHYAIDNPFAIRAGLFTEALTAAYGYWQRERVFGLVPDNNPKSAKLTQHIGFTEVARIPDALADGVGYIVYRLDREDCRWISDDLRRRAA